MKPGYKIIIAGLLIYAVFQVKKIMDVTPYKERASQFVVSLKQNRPFEAQAMLGKKLQSYVSIEQIHTVILEQNLSQSREISWSEWQKKEGNYTLRGEIHFGGTHTVPTQFTLSSPTQESIMVDTFTIGKAHFRAQEHNSTGFLE
jgi:hypothetical protein